MTEDGVEIGRVVYLGRDSDGTPAWMDVAVADAARERLGVDHGRVRMSAHLVAGWDEETLTLGRTLDAVRGRWTPSEAETIDEPSFEADAAPVSG